MAVYLEAEGVSRATYVAGEGDEDNGEGVALESKSLLELSDSEWLARFRLMKLEVVLKREEVSVADVVDLNEEELEDWMTDVKLNPIDKKKLRKAVAETRATKSLPTEVAEKQMWHCPNCTLQNDVCQPICVVCGHLPLSPRSVASGALVDASVTSKALPSHSADSVIVSKHRTDFTIEAETESKADSTIKPSRRSFWSLFGKGSDKTSASKPMKGMEADSGKFSIAQMPECERLKIRNRLKSLHTAKDLNQELERSIRKLEEKLRTHIAAIRKFETALTKLRKERAVETKKCEELQHCAKEYFDNAEAYYLQKIKVERLHISCFIEKVAKLKGTAKKLRRKRKRSVEDMRQSIEGALVVAWRIRLSPETVETQALCESLEAIMGASAEAFRRSTTH